MPFCVTAHFRMVWKAPVDISAEQTDQQHYTHYNITSRLGALCTQDQYLPSPASLSMPLPSNGFPTLPTDQTATAKIRSVYRYVQYALLLSRTLLEVLGCSYYRLGCDFNDSVSGST